MNTTTIKRKELPRFAQNLNVVLTIAMREIILAIKAPSRLFMALMWPVMIFGMFGSQLSQNMGINMGYNFSSFMLVGMLVNGLFMMVMQGLNSLVEDRENDFTQEIFVSPTSRYAILLGKIIGASFVGYICYFATIIVGLIVGATFTASQFWMLLLVSPLMCIAAGSLGMLIVGFIKSPATAGMITMMFAMVQMFLSGAMIPINNSTGVMAVISHAMPMTYCIDLARGLFYSGMPEYESTVMYAPTTNVIIIVAFTLVFFVAGTVNFVRTEKNK